MTNLNPDKEQVMLPEVREYTVLKQSLTQLPVTWYPDLLKTLVEAALDHRVFVDGGATRFVAEIERLRAYCPGKES